MRFSRPAGRLAAKTSEALPTEMSRALWREMNRLPHLWGSARDLALHPSDLGVPSGQSTTLTGLEQRTWHKWNDANHEQLKAAGQVAGASKPSPKARGAAGPPLPFLSQAPGLRESLCGNGGAVQRDLMAKARCKIGVDKETVLAHELLMAEERQTQKLEELAATLEEAVQRRIRRSLAAMDLHRTQASLLDLKAEEEEAQEALRSAAPVLVACCYHRWTGTLNAGLNRLQ
eukprot:Skav220726  [mRNA]  locus=scaffold2753:136594:147700:- [translate_table: standard]